MFLFFLLPFFISLITSFYIKINGSDNSYHLLMIKAIKNNNNRFITTMPYFIDENRHSYPQLMHWFFSFFSKKKTLKYARFTGLIGHLLSGVVLYFFAVYIYYYLELNIEINQYLVFIGLVYSLSPLHYDIFNAKNIGFSARGIGLFLGQAFTYLIIIYLMNGQIMYLVSAGIIVYFIFISSVFAMQYSIFFTILSVIFFFNLLLFLPLVIGLLLFLLVHKKIAILFFKGQYSHKKIYALYLAKKFILKQRYSIWRDFIFDFWIKFGHVIKRRESIFSLIQYIMTNSIINLFFGIPFLVLIIIDLAKKEEINQPNIKIVLIVILISLLMFLLTSFRKTRFLGEPERYVEFSLGLIPIFVLTKYSLTSFTVLGILLFSLVFIILRVFLVNKKMVKDFSLVKKNKDLTSGSLSRSVHFDKVINDLKKIDNNFKGLKVVSNVSQVSKMLLSENYQTFMHPLFQEYIGKYHFNDLFQDSYFKMNLPIVIDVIKEYKIDLFFYAKDAETENVSDLFNNVVVVFEDEIIKVFKFNY